MAVSGMPVEPSELEEKISELDEKSLKLDDQSSELDEKTSEVDEETSDLDETPLPRSRKGSISFVNLPESDTLFYDVFNFKIINQHGNMADLPEDYRDYPYNFRFDFGTIKLESGEEVHLTGNFPSYNTVGYLFDRLNEFSRETERIAHKNCHKFCDDFGLNFEGSKLSKHVEVADNGIFCYFTLVFAGLLSGRHPLSPERIQPYVNMWGYILCFEETFETTKGIRSTWDHSESTLYSDIVEVLIKILKGTEDPQQIDTILVSKCPGFISYCDCSYYFRRSFIELAGNVADAQPALDSLCETLRSYALESICFSPVKKTARRMSNHAFQFVRNMSVSCDLTLEVMMLLGKLKPSSETRNTMLFRLIHHLCCTHAVLLNDICSFRKEVMKGEELNYILLKSKKMPIDEAFKEILTELKEVVRDFKQAKRVAMAVYAENADLHEYIKYCEATMLNHCMWLGSCCRYGDTVFNVVV